MFLFFRSICFVACAGILQWNFFFHVFVSFGCCLTTTIFLVLKYFSSDCGSSFGSRSYFDDLCDGWLSPSRQSIRIQRARVGTTENSFVQNKAVSTCMTRQHSAHTTQIYQIWLYFVLAGSNRRSSSINAHTRPYMNSIELNAYAQLIAVLVFQTLFTTNILSNWIVSKCLNGLEHKLHRYW